MKWLRKYSTGTIFSTQNHHHQNKMHYIHSIQIQNVFFLSHSSSVSKSYAFLSFISHFPWTEAQDTCHINQFFFTCILCCKRAAPNQTANNTVKITYALKWWKMNLFTFSLSFLFFCKWLITFPSSPQTAVYTSRRKKTSLFHHFNRTHTQNTHFIHTCTQCSTPLFYILPRPNPPIFPYYNIFPPSVSFWQFCEILMSF